MPTGPSVPSHAGDPAPAAVEAYAAGHDDLVRAGAQAVELVTGLLDEAALGRIKDAIFGEIALRRPASVPKDEYDRTMRRRLDALFAGNEALGQKPPVAIGPVMGAK